MESTNNYVPMSEYRALKAENERLKQRNANLYRDCVSFAKLIKASSKKDEKIEELLEEIENLNAQIDSLKAQNNFETNVVTAITDQKSKDEAFIDSQAEAVAYDPNKVQYIDESEFIEQDELNLNNDYENTKDKKKNKSKKKKSPRAFFKTFICILFIISLLVSITSGISYLFCTRYKDYTIGGFRFCSVYNNAMIPDINKDDVVLVKYCGFDGLEINSFVVTTKNTRSIGKIKDLSVTGNKSVATIEDKYGTYEVSEKQFIGKVEFKLPQIGNIVRFASASPYNYFAIIVSSNFIFLAIFLLIPSSKSKKPKFGKDYNVEDFTI